MLPFFIKLGESLMPKSVAPILVALSAAIATGAVVWAQDSPTQLLPDQIKWAALPSDVAPGATATVLVGPLDQPVHYTVRVHLDKGGIVTPHTHPDNRYVTVLAGEVYAGMGDTVSEATSKRFPAGSFFVLPAGHVHYSWAKDGEVTYQESGIGPTSSTYVKK
jgi:quercetin dioxygenase-like cupin family protein